MTAINEFFNEAMDLINHAEFQKFSQDEEREIITTGLGKIKETLLERYKYSEEQGSEPILSLHQGQ